MAAMTMKHVKIKDQGENAVHRWHVSLLTPDGKMMLSTNGSLHGSKTKATAEAKRLAGIYRCEIVEG